MPEKPIEGIKYQDVVQQFIEMSHIVGCEVIEAKAEDDINALIQKAYPDAKILASNVKGIKADLNPDTVSKAQDLNGKKVGLFGCGDSDGYADTFCGALVQIYDALQDTGATFVGAYEPEGYQVTDSELNRDGKFLGLALDAADEENNPERIAKWVELVK